MEATEAARAWVEAWARGWRDHDADVIAARYAEGCEFRSHPFREPLHGPGGARSYALQAFAEERVAKATFVDPIVGHDGRAAVEYRAEITTTHDDHETLAGVTVLRFNRDGLVTEHRDYWAMQ